MVFRWWAIWVPSEGRFQNARPPTEKSRKGRLSVQCCCFGMIDPTFLDENGTIPPPDLTCTTRSDLARQTIWMRSGNRT